MFKGEVTVVNGHVTGMSLPASGKFKYVYDSSKNLPVGIPSEIVSLDKNGKCFRKIRIEEFHFGTMTDDFNRIFDPIHIMPEAAIPSVWSNSVLVSKAESDKDSLVRIQSDHQASRIQTEPKRFSIQRSVIIGFIILLVVLLMRLAFKRRAR